jgi:hypothetical protein
LIPRAGLGEVIGDSREARVAERRGESRCWPSSTSSRRLPAPLDADGVAGRFLRARRDRVAAILARLAERRLIIADAGRYTRSAGQRAA